MLLNDDEDEISDDEDMKIDDAEDENGTDQEIDAGSKTSLFRLFFFINF